MNESSNLKLRLGRRVKRILLALTNVAATPKCPKKCVRWLKNNIAQARQMYERSKDALEAVLASWERSFDAASQGAAAINRKVIEITQRNINSGFEYAKGLAGAKNLAEVMELQTAYWRKQLSMLGAQAEEMRDLSSQVTTDVTAPIQAQVKRGMDELQKAT